MDYKEKVKHGTPGFPFKIYKNGLDLYSHYHREFEILYIRQGKGCAYIDDKCLLAQPGDVFFINSGQLHGIVSDGDEKGEFTAFVFAPEFLGEFDDVFTKYVLPVTKNAISIPTKPENNPLLVQALEELSANYEEKFFELNAKSMMFKIWQLLLSASTPCSTAPKDDSLREIKIAIDYIQHNHQQNISLADLAKLTHMSRVYFCKKFTKAVGISPIEYLIRVRIEKSCQMLKDTGRSIGSIATECGFPSFSYYSKMFKRIMDCTPSQYRSSKIPTP